MNTRKLYYEDCHLSRFSARVLSCCPADKGWEVVLDATAFYPEGGGQPCDLGTLGRVRVLDVQEREDTVVHLCDGPLEPGSEVEGVLDWERRFALMQQHTGEHILSGLVNRRWGYHNVGFHMGSQLMTVDFDGPIPQEELASLEGAVNAALWQNLPLRCWVPSPEELPQVAYRSKRQLPWPVRIVEVPGYDACACCGVHTATTGEVGLLKIFSAISFKGGTRMEIACGIRALELLSQVFDQNRQVSQAFSAKIWETGQAARQMNEMLEREKFRCAQIRKRLFRTVADSYVNHGDVVLFEEDLDSVGVRDLADAIAEVCGGMAAVFSGADGQGYSYCLVTRQGDLRSLGKEMTVSLGGRGGGKPNFQQGRVAADREKIQAFFRQV